MPAVVLIAIGFGAGIVAGLVSFLPAWLPAAAAIVCWRRVPRLAVTITMMAAGVIWGDVTRAARDNDCRWRWRDGERLTVRVAPRGLPAPGRMQRLRLVGPRGCRGVITVMFPAADTALMVREVSGVWRRDLLERRPWHRPSRSGRLLVREQLSARAPERLSAQLAAERQLVHLFGPARAPLAAALTVSADAAIPREERDVYTRAGLAHLLSISGFHVALLAGVLMVILRVLRQPPDRARLIATLAVAAYVAMLGANAPALRAGLVIGIWWWARLRQRPPPASAVIACCALAIMVADPLALFEAGPWLSFAGVWGCIASSRLWSRVTREARASESSRLRLLAPVFVSLGASLATAPITILVFGVATPAALVANLAAVPLAAFAVPAIALAVVLGLAGLRWPAELAASAGGLSLDLLQHVAVFAGNLPGANLRLSGMIPALIAALAALVLLRALPARTRRPAARALAARSALVVLLLAAGSQATGFAGIGSSDADGRLTLHFLAVGQGDATLIRTPRGRWIIVDGGPRSGGIDAGARRIVPFLRRHRVSNLAVVIASHGHADHVGGLPAVLRAVPADLIMDPGEPLDVPSYRAWLADAARHGQRWRAARAGDSLEIDGVMLPVWHPDSAWMTRRASVNDNSVVLTIEYGSFRALLPGDAGLPMERLRAAAIGDVTLLKVGHHGSAGATGAAWLAATRPELCIIPVGANGYGHPHPEVVAALAQAGCHTRRTDQGGDIIVSTDGGTTSVTQGRESHEGIAQHSAQSRGDDRELHHRSGAEARP